MNRYAPTLKAQQETPHDNSNSKTLPGLIHEPGQTIQDGMLLFNFQGARDEEKTESRQPDNLFAEVLLLKIQKYVRRQKTSDILFLLGMASSLII